MKKILLILLVFFCNYTYAQKQKVNTPWCTAGDSQPDIENITNKSSVNKILSNTKLIDTNGVIIIPVVFHILHNPNIPAEDIPDSVILSQLARLNADFRRKNSDTNSVPSIWWPLRADLKFEFRLACVDPDGISTNGIIKKPVLDNYIFCNVPSSPQPIVHCVDARLKALNGADAWPTDTYLNIWVFNMEDAGGINGASTFPWMRHWPDVTVMIGGNPVTIERKNLDGIILDYKVVGDPSLSAINNKGRVLTHEVGHWLGLYHTYQRDSSGTGQACFPPGDFVDDTPPQFGNTSYCATAPLYDFCSPGPPPDPGIMFMNYMNGAPDDCRYFYTTGQKDRARSYFSETGPFGTRFPYIQNYFGIKRFTITPHLVQNNLITVPFNNPACLPITFFSYNGPVSVISQDEKRVIFSVPCGISGTISLTITSGNYTDYYVFDFVNGGCTWPKVYSYSRGPNCLLKDNANNFVVKFLITDITQSINHNGAFPTSPPSTYDNLTLQYGSSGITDWYIEHPQMPTYGQPEFITSAGDVQWDNSPSNTLYTSSGTGLPSNGPPILASITNEIIIAEVNSNAFITKTPSSINLHSSNGISSILITGSIITKFNPFNNKLFIIETTVTLPYTTTVSVFIINNGAFTLDLSHSIPNLSFIQIDNSDNIYFLNNHILEKYNYQTNVFTSVNILNFTNSDIYGLWSNNPNTEDRCLLVNRNEDHLYSLDFSDSTAKKVSAINLPYINSPIYQYLSRFYYAYDLDNVYITGSTQSSNDLQIGNQLIPVLGIRSVFFTKFDLSEFSFSSQFPDNYSFRQMSGNYFLKATEKSYTTDKGSNLNTKIIFDAVLSPNPVKDLLSVRIPDGLSTNSVYTISIYNNVGVNVIEINKTGKSIFIDTQKLNPGSYFILIRDEKGNRLSKVFIKI